MRSEDEQTGALFSYLSAEALVPLDHPMRAIRVLVNRALKRRWLKFSVLSRLTGRDGCSFSRPRPVTSFDCPGYGRRLLRPAAPNVGRFQPPKTQRIGQNVSLTKERTHLLSGEFPQTVRGVLRFARGGGEV